MLTSQCIKFHSLQISQKDITYWIVCFFVWSILSFFDSVIIVTINNTWAHTRQVSALAKGCITLLFFVFQMKICHFFWYQIWGCVMAEGVSCQSRHHRGMGSIWGQFTWGLWCIKLYWDEIFFKHVDFALSLSFHRSFRLMHSSVTTW